MTVLPQMQWKMLMFFAISLKKVLLFLFISCYNKASDIDPALCCA